MGTAGPSDSDGSFTITPTGMQNGLGTVSVQVVNPSGGSGGSGGTNFNPASAAVSFVQTGDPGSLNNTALAGLLSSLSPGWNWCREVGDEFHGVAGGGDRGG